jgi:Mrp family chromosome partitioning ATPase
LAKESAGALFQGLRQAFDFIVVDAPPVLAAADALLVGQHTDAALVSVLRHKSRTPGVYEASRRLTALGIPIFGAVLHGVRGGAFASRAA